MSDDFTIVFEGLPEMQEKLEKVRSQFPFEEETILKKLGSDLRKSAKDKTPIGNDKKHLKDSYKLSPVNYEKDITNIQLISKSPIWHLVEAGHKRVSGKKGQTLGKGGKDLGWTPGHFMVEKSALEMEKTLPITVTKMLDKVLGDNK